MDDPIYEILVEDELDFPKLAFQILKDKRWLVALSSLSFTASYPLAHSLEIITHSPALACLARARSLASLLHL